ncbi:MAG: hypothetical protein HRT68_16640, partial [Flavobacteriaceae bacterium]|nr:hypothetical protein [Flavobacteriaceae bacterium]
SWFNLIEVNQALDLWDILFTNIISEVYIGLNFNHADLKYYIDYKRLDNQKINIFYQKLDLEIKHVLQEIKNKEVCRVVPVDDLNDYNSYLDEALGRIQLSVYEEPKSKIQRTIADSWSNVLAPDRIGINDNFFYLGGNSIKAIQLIAILSTKNIKLSIRTLYEYPILKDLASFLETKSNDNSSIVKLNYSHPLKENIYFIHAANCEVETYRELGSILEGKFNLTGIQPSTIYNKGKLPASVPDLISSYLDEIQDTPQNNYPISIIGYSLSTQLAFEMVKQMNLRGLEVSNLLLFDNEPDEKCDNSEMVNFRTNEIFKSILKSFFDIEYSGKLKNEKLLDYLICNEKNVPENLKNNYEILDRYLKTVRNMYEIVMNYEVTGHINTDIAYFTTESKLDLPSRWKEMTTGNFTKLKIKGSHSTFFMSDNIQENSRIISRFLNTI